MRPMDYLVIPGALIKMHIMSGKPCREIKGSGTWPTEQTQATEQCTQSAPHCQNSFRFTECGVWGEREVIKRPCGGFSCLLGDEAMMLLLRPLAAVLLCTLKFLLHFLERVEGWSCGRRAAQRQKRGAQVEVVLEDQVTRPQTPTIFTCDTVQLSFISIEADWEQ